MVVGGVANVAAPNGTGGGGSTLRGEHSRNGRYQGGSNKPWHGQNSSWGNAPKDMLGGGFGKGGFSPAQMVQVFGEAMRQMGSASAGGKGFGQPKGAGGPKTWVCRSCQCSDNWPDRESCRICGVSWRFKGLAAPGGDEGVQGGNSPSRSPSREPGVGDAKGKGKGKKGTAGTRSATPRAGLLYATSTGLWGQKGGGGGKGRKGQGEHGPAGAAAPLDGSWQEQRTGRSASRNRFGFEP